MTLGFPARVQIKGAKENSEDIWIDVGCSSLEVVCGLDRFQAPANIVDRIFTLYPETARTAGLTMFRSID
jgi:hypothetical protein